MQLMKTQVAEFFSSDAEVQAAVLSCLGLVSISIFFDSLVTVTLGIIKGIGKQAQATIAYLVCFYLISVPASYYFCFT
jgi:Na+-driven multidrug efflux pump